MCTVQQPQKPSPQPNFVPLSPIVSLITQSSGVDGSTSTEYFFLLMDKFIIAIFFSSCFKKMVNMKMVKQIKNLKSKERKEKPKNAKEKLFQIKENRKTKSLRTLRKNFAAFAFKVLSS